MSDTANAQSLLSRASAVALLRRIESGVPDSELAPVVRELMTHDDEQAFAIMRGSGNEMSVSLQLLTLLEARKLISEEEVFEAEDARVLARRRGAA